MGDGRSYLEQTEQGWLDSEILKVGHHGAETSTSADWLTAVQPKAAVISAAYSNTYGHPRKDVVDRYKGYTKNIDDDDVEEAGESQKHKIRYWKESNDGFSAENQDTDEGIFLTATNGHIVIITDRSGYLIETQK